MDLRVSFLSGFIALRSFTAAEPIGVEMLFCFPTGSTMRVPLVETPLFVLYCKTKIDDHFSHDELSGAAHHEPPMAVIPSLGDRLGI